MSPKAMVTAEKPRNPCRCRTEYRAEESLPSAHGHNSGSIRHQVKPLLFDQGKDVFTGLVEFLRLVDSIAADTGSCGGAL
jgi:hypothetical protein